MSRECNTEELEALVQGRLDAATAQAVEAHAADCATCREELSWLRTEAALMARRREQARPLSPALWDNVAARIAEPRIVTPPDAEQPATARDPISPSLPPRQLHWGVRVAYSAAIAAAAAALLFVAWPHGPRLPLAEGGLDAAMGTQGTLAHRHKKLPPEVALSNAEHEYQEALSVLEAQYKAKRGQLPPSLAKRYDTMLQETRTRVVDARASAGNDVDGRVLVLDGYEEYLRSLQKIVSDIH